MKIRLLATATTLLAVSVSNANAEAVEVNARIAKLEEELALLKRQLAVKEEIATAKAEKTPDITFDKKGLAISSPDKNFTLRAGGVAQFDSREFFDSNGEDDFIARRIRPIITGTAYKDFSFRFMPDFTGGNATILDAHIDYKLYDELQFRFGKFKPSVGLERLRSATDLTFAERGHPSNLVPNRDIGFQVYGEIIPDTLEYQLGIFNGSADLANANSDDDSHKDFAGRIFAHPFNDSGITELEGFGVGVGGSIGDHEGNNSAATLPSYKTPGQTDFFSYAAGSYADGTLWHLQPQAYYYYNNFGLLGEYGISHQEVGRPGFQESFDHVAWQFAASFVLTGENINYKGGVKPEENFDPKNNGCGAFELVARVGETDIDNDVFSSGFANIATSASKASTIGTGLNWYLNENIKLMFDYEQTSFDGGAAAGADRDDEKVIFSRLQFKL